MGQFLIPANSKKSMLIFGLFNKLDLIIFLIGVGISILLLMIFPVESLFFAILALSPGVICSVLVIPIPNYHNVMVLIREVINFYYNRRNYKWRGWCYKDEYK